LTNDLKLLIDGLKASLGKNKKEALTMSDNVILKYVLIATFIFGGSFWASLYGPGAEKNCKNISEGEYYLTNASKPIEINIDNGFFNSNTNKLNCDGVIVNIPTDEYERLVLIYTESKKK
jgi:hypothetical protein